MATGQITFDGSKFRAYFSPSPREHVVKVGVFDTEQAALLALEEQAIFFGPDCEKLRVVAGSYPRGTRKMGSIIA